MPSGQISLKNTGAILLNIILKILENGRILTIFT